MADRLPRLIGRAAVLVGTASSVTGATARWLLRTAAALAVVTLMAVAGLIPIGIVRVDGTSMVPTITPGDRVLFLRDVDPRRGQVVLAGDPDGNDVVKRVVAVGGDHLAISDGVLVVNGTPVAEPYADPLGTDGEYVGPLTVPPGSVYLLGDRRGWSHDSRTFGPVPTEAVEGVVLTVLGHTGPAPAGG